MTAPGAEAAPDDRVQVSVVISTRNRGDRLRDTVTSLLANDWEAFELLVIDQSDDDRTADCIRAFDDQRVRYLRSRAIGLSSSRNLALREAKHEIIVMTDDDCVAASNFVGTMVDELLTDPDATVIFADVLEPEKILEMCTPTNRAGGNYAVNHLGEWRSNDGVNIGIGAAMAFRKQQLCARGGFDEVLGAGAPFLSAEDTDLALRVLLSGGKIRRTTRTWVYHHGPRTIEETRELIRNAMFGVGAVCGKLVRARHWTVLAYLWQVFWVLVVVSGCAEVARGRRPAVVGRADQLVKGFVAGLRHPVIEQPPLLFPLFRP